MMATMRFCRHGKNTFAFSGLSICAGYGTCIGEGDTMITECFLGAVSLIFGVAIVKSVVLSRWIGAVGIAAGVVVAYVGFSSVRDPVTDLSTFIFYPWLVILGIFMWRKTRLKKMVAR